MVDRSGQPDERNSSKAQIRTLLEEQRQTILAEYREKVGHHELQAAQVEEERRLLQAPSTLLHDENWARIRTLSWNFPAEYRNCKTK